MSDAATHLSYDADLSLERDGSSEAAVLLLLAAICAVLFSADVLFPEGIAAAAAVLASLIWARRRVRTVEALAALAVLIAFIVPICQHFFFLAGSDIRVLTARREELIGELDVRQAAANLNLVGTLALLAGMTSGLRAGRKALEREARQWRRIRVALTSGQFVFLLGAAMLIYYLSAPIITVFEVQYGEIGTPSRASSIGLESGAYIAYLFFAALFIEALRDGNPARRRLRTLVLVACVGFGVVAFGWVRGNRTSAAFLGWLACILAFWRPWKSGPTLPVPWRRLVAVALFVLTLGLVLEAVGFMRQSLSANTISEALTLFQLNPNAGLFAFQTSGTYSTMAAVEGRMHLGEPLLWGKTYIDYLLSLPPGPVARLLDYVRPLNLEGSPSWWYNDATQGGVFITVVPFRNFGVVGTLVHVWGTGWLSGRLSSGLNRKGLLWPLFSAAVFIVSLQWMWYGEMYMVRIMMAVVLLAALFWVVRRLHAPAVEAR